MTSRLTAGRVVLYLILLLGVVFAVAPIAIVVVNSFNASSFGEWPPPGFSTRWYTNLFENGGFGGPAIRSIELALVATAGSLILGTLAALGLSGYRLRGKRPAQGFLVSPLIVPKVAIGFGAFILFLKIGWYGSFGSLVLAHIVITLPFVVTMAVAGLARVDHTIEEAAMDLGATPLQVVRYATLPQMRGALLAAAAFSMIISFDELDASIFIVGEHSNTLPTAMYIYMQKYDDPTLAALSTLLIGASLVIAVVIGILIARIGGMRALSSVRAGSTAVALEDAV